MSVLFRYSAKVITTTSITKVIIIISDLRQYIYVGMRPCIQIELRVRTELKLVLHENHYLQPKIASLLWCVDDHGQQVKRLEIHTPRLHASLVNIDRASELEQSVASTLVRDTFIFDTLDTTKEGTHCLVWHVDALASVLMCPIQSV